MHFGSSPEERNRWMSGCPSFQDQYPQYVDVTDGAMVQYNGSRNPFAYYGTNNMEVTRQNRWWFDDKNADATVITNLGWNAARTEYTFRCREPVFISPLNWSEKDVVGLLGIQNLQIQYTFGQLGRVWSDFLVPNLNPETNATITTATFVGTPKLHLEYISPQINQPIPSVTFYPYYEVGRYITKGSDTPLAVGASVSSKPSDTITFSSIPKRIYV